MLCQRGSGWQCGCSAGRTTVAAESADIRETVRERYAQAARAAATPEPESASCGCAPFATTDAGGAEVFGAALYERAGRRRDHGGGAGLTRLRGADRGRRPARGETVLDLGSGAGADVLISARRVGPSGRAIGLDMTDEMLELARANAAQAGVENVEFIKGYIEEIPLPDASVDVVISNCVINLAADKRRVIAEAARVLRAGGRFAVSDVIADPDMDAATRADMAQWTGCIAGALTEAEFRAALTDAGLSEIEIRPTHRVHAHAGLGDHPRAQMTPPPTLGRRASAEAIGTFALVFAGCGAVVTDAERHGALGVVGVGLVFFLVLVVAIAALGHISGLTSTPASASASSSPGICRRATSASTWSPSCSGRPSPPGCCSWSGRGTRRAWARPCRASRPGVRSCSSSCSPRCSCS